MALQPRPADLHNRMLRQTIPHPASTNFNDEYLTPRPKRRKISTKNENEEDASQRSGDEIPALERPQSCPKEIPDSDADSDGEDITLRSAQQTNLESALPPVETDADAIRKYEATRAAENADLDLKGRLGQRKWIPGKSSIYVDAFNLALETVLEEESHLFNEAELKVFDEWRNLSYEGQYLWVSLDNGVDVQWD